MRETIKLLFKSRKAVASMTGVVASIIVLVSKSFIGEELAIQIAGAIVLMVMTYVGSQGVADHGDKDYSKEKLLKKGKL